LDISLFITNLLFLRDLQNNVDKLEAESEDLSQQTGDLRILLNKIKEQGDARLALYLKKKVSG
jgi:hypothetical protein